MIPSLWERETASMLGSEKYRRAAMKLSDISRAITNICQCGTSQRMRLAIRRAAELARG
jgi:aerobic-type carbon monoxide dehydrogenase small subunit (CoxS/CutS family)